MGEGYVEDGGGVLGYKFVEGGIGELWTSGTVGICSNERDGERSSFGRGEVN